ncbi:hypothetical protein DLAC_11748 [Tieghemostelium lacteum]|uniref:PH domain-containing protein n=1 Tax=Tieghemostelium lacteum TaxID=361077 RepID=A0A151Z8I5_TIELA|nr:hypothetical protein DLAC_11748 [Tieghemostelium lacteum]|eukprot:KYQ90270.1 hypothetical protein DLAC_11748 [Tieghemostelium lacteum]
MNKTFNKLFRKSVSLNANDQQQLNNQVSQANYSPPPTHNSGGGLQHSTSSPNATLSQQQQGHIGGSNSNSSGSLSSSSSIALSSSKSFNGVPSQLSSSSSSPNSSQLHLNKEIQHNYQTLPLIDYEYILNSYIKEGDSLKSYFLIHSILSKKGPSSSGNLKEHQHTSKSWQPFFKKNSYPCFLAICQRNLLILDATNQPFSLTRRIPLIDLKEIIFDSTDLGIFSIETHINQQQRIDFNNNLLFFSIGCEKKEISDLILNSLEEALRESSIFNKGNSIIKKIKMVGERDQNTKKGF